MSNIWFTSDHHFGHTNIIKHANRPFASVEEMDEALIVYWNERVRPEDTVHCLGDFAFHRQEVAQDILDRLHGRKHLIAGNHDKFAFRLEGWETIRNLHEIEVGRRKIVLCHYAMRVWNKSHYGSWMLYGHSHGNLPGDSQSCDVGVDAWSYRPVSLDEIEARLATLPPHQPVDHHGR